MRMREPGLCDIEPGLCDIGAGVNLLPRMRMHEQAGLCDRG